MTPAQRKVAADTKAKFFAGLEQMGPKISTGTQAQQDHVAACVAWVKKNDEPSFWESRRSWEFLSFLREAGVELKKAAAN